LDINPPVSFPPNATSVVIPTKDRPASIARLMTALLAQTLPPHELIVVDQSDDDQSERAVTEAIAATPAAPPPRLVYVRDPAIDGAAAARNEGLRRSTAPLVAFCDDDGVPDRRALELLSSALLESKYLTGVGAVIVNYLPPPLMMRAFLRTFYRGPFRDERQPTYWGWRDYVPGQILVTGKLNGGLMVSRRESVAAIGGFDPRYKGASVGEDIELSQRLEKVSGGRGSLALVGGAWLTNDSLGEWKKPDRILEFELVASHYRFVKNVPKTIGNLVRYGWMVVGILAYASLASARRGSWSALESCAAGIRCIRPE
jgi:GT2 family glycosyltransferase